MRRFRRVPLSPVFSSAPSASDAVAPPEREPRAKSVLFLARSLGVGGAERQLALLARGLSARDHRIAIACFYSGGLLESDLIDSGVRVIDLGKRGRWDIGGFSRRLVEVVRRERPDIIHAYLPVPNLLAVCLRRWAAGARIVWGVRASDMDFTRYDRLEQLTFALTRRMASRADLIIANSWAGLRHHADHGYPEDRMCVIPNGIDTERFRPDASARARVRAEWGVADDTPLVGIVARLDPMKGHEIFLRAFAMLRQSVPTARAVCVGDGPAAYAERLRQTAATLGIADSVLWTGIRTDAVAVYNALDVVCSSSVFGEGFSNALAEALACGTPCVSSDVGDASYLLGELEGVVPRHDPRALADAIAIKLAARSPRISGACRDRVLSNFSVEQLVARSAARLFADQ